MRVIIIEEERFTEIRSIMKYEFEKMAARNPDPRWKEAIAAAEQATNYHFVRWAQSHGASCVSNP